MSLLGLLTGMWLTGLLTRSSVTLGIVKTKMPIQTVDDNIKSMTLKDLEKLLSTKVSLHTAVYCLVRLLSSLKEACNIIRFSELIISFFHLQLTENNHRYTTLRMGSG